MRSEHFSRLSANPWAICDLGSALELFSYSTKLFLAGDDQDFSRLRRDWAYSIGQRPTFLAETWTTVVRSLTKYMGALRLLEQLVAHECLVLDSALVAMRDFKEAENEQILDSPYVVLSEVPDAVRRSAAGDIRENREQFHKVAMNKVSLSSAWYDFDKIAHDRLGRGDVDKTYFEYCFANSEDSAERAFFYLSVARAAGLPLVVSPLKQASLDELWADICTNLHERITALAGRGNADDARAQIRDEFAPLRFELPPIQEMIVVRCLTKGLSPFEAFVSIRDSDEARKYRAFVKEVFTEARGPSGGRHRAAETMKKLATQVDQWKVDPFEGIAYKKATLNLQRIPVAGWLAAVVDMKPIELPAWLGRMLNTPEPHLVFISRWFRSPQDQFE